MSRVFSHLCSSMSMAYMALALLTAVILFSFRATGMAYEQQVLEGLSREAKTFQVVIQDRLIIADQVLASVTGASSDLRLPYLPRVGGEYFSSVSYIDPVGNRTLIYGNSTKAPVLTEAVQLHLARGDAAVLALHSAGGSPVIFMLRTVVQDDGPSGLLVAELNPHYLWRHAQSAQHKTDFHVLDHGRRLLYSSNPLDLSGAGEAFGQHTRSLLGDLRWNDGITDHVASYLSMPVNNRYFSNGWLVVADRPAISVLGVIPGAFWILGSLAMMWLTLLMIHASRLRNKPNAIQVLSDCPDFGRSPENNEREQASSGPRFDILNVMGEIDRAILSNATIDQIVDMVLARALKVVPCMFVAITRFGKIMSGHANTLVLHRQGARATYSCDIDKHFRRALDASPNGYWLDHAAAYPLIPSAAELGAWRYLLFPVYRDGELSAILHFGLDQDSALTGEQLEVARHFADRLGVALTAVMRAKELYIQEHFDPITALPNRRFCIERLSQEISRASLNPLQLAILFVSLKGFKKVNDSAGYAGGDSVLQQVADRLRSGLRESDFLARFGNDEFVVLLLDTLSMTEVNRVAEKLIGLFSEHFSYEEHVCHLNVDIGISLYPEDGQSVDALLQNANLAMMRIKAKGQGQYMFYEEQMSASATERLSLERDLRLALQKNQLFLVYQPQADLRNGKISGAEALVRWHHPRLGLVPPLEFVGLAEEAHLICQLGEYVRRAFCEQYRIWTAQGVTPPRIALNVSSEELLRSNFADEFLSVFNEFDVPISAIELEITESLLVDEAGHVVETLRHLSGKGVRIAVDDFGTGYSCLSYLARLPFDVLKVDRSFVSEIGLHSEAYEIVAMIIDIAHHLGKTVVAEGVEDEVQRRFLVEHGCEVLQGFIVSKPLPADDFVAFLQQWQADHAAGESLS